MGVSLQNNVPDDLSPNSSVSPPSDLGQSVENNNDVSMDDDDAITIREEEEEGESSNANDNNDGSSVNVSDKCIEENDSNKENVSGDVMEVDEPADIEVVLSPSSSSVEIIEEIIHPSCSPDSEKSIVLKPKTSVSMPRIITSDEEESEQNSEGSVVDEEDLEFEKLIRKEKSQKKGKNKNEKSPNGGG